VKQKKRYRKNRNENVKPHQLQEQDNNNKKGIKEPRTARIGIKKNHNNN